MVINLVQHPDSDPRIRALAELLHHIRPNWDRAGIRSALLTTSLSKTFEQTTRAAIGAVFDTTAATPGVIPHRDGDSFSHGTAQKNEPRMPYDRPKKNGQPEAIADLPPPGDYDRGAAEARARVRAAIDAAKAAGHTYKGDPE